MGSRTDLFGEIGDNDDDTDDHTMDFRPGDIGLFSFEVSTYFILEDKQVDKAALPLLVSAITSPNTLVPGQIRP